MSDIGDLINNEPEGNYGVEIDINGQCASCLMQADKVFYSKAKKQLTTICSNGSNDHIVSWHMELDWLM